VCRGGARRVRALAAAVALAWQAACAGYQNADATRSLDAGPNGDASLESDGGMDAAAATEASADAPDDVRCSPVAVAPAAGGGTSCVADASTCYPHDQTAFFPSWAPPLAPSHVCSTEQIDDFWTSCLDPATADPSSCGIWRAADTTCYGCLVTSSSAPAYGALVTFGPHLVSEVNVAGCIALTERCNVACAQMVLADVECRQAACDGWCPDQAVAACADTADQCSTCSTYHDAAAGCVAPR